MKEINKNAATNPDVVVNPNVVVGNGRRYITMPLNIPPPGTSKKTTPTRKIVPTNKPRRKVRGCSGCSRRRSK